MFEALINHSFREDGFLLGALFRSHYRKGKRMKILVSLKDTATQAFGTPFLVATPAQAVRSLRDAVNGKDGGDISAHPEDFELYEVATFDEETGVVVAASPLQLVCRAKDLKESA